MPQPNEMLPTPSHEISVDLAIEMTSRYREFKEQILAAGYQNDGTLALCETFSKTAIQNLIEGDECTGFRIYYGMDDALKVHALLVGVNAEGVDILPVNPNVPTSQLLEDGHRNPPANTPSSPLNE